MYLTLIATYAGIFIAVEAKVRTFPNAEIQSEITSDFLLTRSAILRVLYPKKDNPATQQQMDKKKTRFRIIR